MGSSSFNPFSKVVKQTANLAQSKMAIGLNKEILESGISERSKKEFSDQLGVFLKEGSRSGINVGEISKQFQAARSGTDPKYRARLQTEELFKTMMDRPDARRLRGQALQFGSVLRK